MGFLKGKTAIITGGGKATPLADGSAGSIGYGIATAYAKEGANLVLTGRNMQKLLDAKEELEKNYGIKVSRMNLVVLHPELPTYKVVPVPVMEREINVILNKIK